MSIVRLGWGCAPWKALSCHRCLSRVLSAGSSCFLDVQVVVASHFHFASSCCVTSVLHAFQKMPFRCPSLAHLQWCRLLGRRKHWTLARTKSLRGGKSKAFTDKNLNWIWIKTGMVTWQCYYLGKINQPPWTWCFCLFGTFTTFSCPLPLHLSE